MSALGEHLRRLREELKREDKKFSLRQLAEKAGVTPGYLSQVENGQVVPSDDKLRILAAELREDPDVLMILAGRLSDELRSITAKRPKLFSSLIKQLKNAPDHAILRVVREVRDGDW